jgi:hypothetical protein
MPPARRRSAAPPARAFSIGPVIEWSPPIETTRVPAASNRLANASMWPIETSLSMASGSGTSPASLIRQTSQGVNPNRPWPRRYRADTWRTARGPRCWSRSVEPLPEEWGMPISAMSLAAGSSFHGQRKKVGMPHQYQRAMSARAASQSISLTGPFLSRLRPSLAATAARSRPIRSAARRQGRWRRRRPARHCGGRSAASPPAPPTPRTPSTGPAPRGCRSGRSATSRPAA